MSLRTPPGTTALEALVPACPLVDGKPPPLGPLRLGATAVGFAGEVELAGKREEKDPETCAR
jgi:hypothetical protein